jgi:agmatinase
MAEHRTFAGIPEEMAGFEQAAVLLQSIPYDGTSTWGKGADKGYEVFLEASENMELYNIETGTEVYRKGIHLMDPLTEDRSPEKVFEAVQARTRELLQTGKFLTFFGGEHSISIGIIEAFREHFGDLTVLQLDAHTDLRSTYLGSPYNHACAMHLASTNTNLVQVGIRSMDISENQYLDPSKCFFAHELDEEGMWMERSLDLLGEKVYVTFDLDVLDPSIMPATGTPEPGGLLYYQVLDYLKKVFLARSVVGFDIVEFAPLPGLKAPGFLVAKLYYTLLSYQFNKIP